MPGGQQRQGRRGGNRLLERVTAGRAEFRRHRHVKATGWAAWVKPLTAFLAKVRDRSIVVMTAWQCMCDTPVVYLRCFPYCRHCAIVLFSVQDIPIARQDNLPYAAHFLWYNNNIHGVRGKQPGVDCSHQWLSHVLRSAGTRATAVCPRRPGRLSRGSATFRQHHMSALAQYAEVIAFDRRAAGVSETPATGTASRVLWRYLCPAGSSRASAGHSHGDLGWGTAGFASRADRSGACHRPCARKYRHADRARASRTCDAGDVPWH